MSEKQEARIDRQRRQLCVLTRALGMHPRDIPEDTQLAFDGEYLHLERIARDSNGDAIRDRHGAIRERVRIRITTEHTVIEETT